jgi:hypothetical protein
MVQRTSLYYVARHPKAAQLTAFITPGEQISIRQSMKLAGLKGISSAVRLLKHLENDGVVTLG